MQLNSKALGLAIGVVSAGVWFVIMTVSLLTGFLDQTIQAIGSFHPGFSYTWMGLLYVVVMHLVAGFGMGFVIALVYNQFNR